MALDVGKKRTGVAVSDPLRIIANGLTTVQTGKLFEFLKEYFEKEVVDLLVVGMPRQMNNQPSEAVLYVQPVVNRFKKLYPQLPIVFADERFTSKIALQTMIDGGMRKSQRREKERVDTISATIILQSYMSSLDYNSSYQ